MKFLKFLFTARMSFLWFTLLAFAFTVLYFGWGRRNETRLAPHPAAAQTR